MTIAHLNCFPDPHKIAALKRELWHYERQPARNQAEREEIECRCAQLRHLIELAGKGLLSTGHRAARYCRGALRGSRKR